MGLIQRGLDVAGLCTLLNAMLDAALTMTHRGIRDSGFAWDRDDLRYRQLRKLGR